MDSGLAVVIGAAIGLIASTFSPWFLAKLDRRGREEREQRDAIRDAIVATTRGLTRMHLHRVNPQNSESAFEETMLAITDLGLALSKDDAAVEELAMATLLIVQTGNVEQVAAGLGAWQTATHRWYRREIASGEIIETARAEAGKPAGPIL